MIPIKINNIEILVPNNFTILQACTSLNIDIPRFCFHESLEIAGNCRMCLVELKNSLKPVVACAMPVSKNMEIFTNTPFVKKAREGVLEFLLLNHPLDCPICDQGGECDLQDQTMRYGSDKSRYFEWKRGVEDKNFGPFIKTIMTRCIHCTRCVRFVQDLTSLNSLGTIGRGTKTEISFYLKNFIHSEFSGNVIDLCPVGALVSKPSSFQIRSWDLEKKHFINCMDSLGSSIEIHIVNNRIIRVLPTRFLRFNIDWISDKTRFFFDSLELQRIGSPLLKKNDIFVPISWFESFLLIKEKLNDKDSSEIQTIIGNLTDLESIFYLKQWLVRKGSDRIKYYSQKHYFNNDFSKNLRLPFSFLRKTRFCLIIGCFIRQDLPILSLYLKKQAEKNQLKIYTIGVSLDHLFPVKHLGNSMDTFIQILEGKHFICREMKISKFPIFLFNSNISDQLFFFKRFIKYSHILEVNWFFLFTESSFLNCLELQVQAKYFYKKANKILFLFNTDSVLSNPTEFIIYQGHHFSTDAQKADLVLPGLTIFEKSGSFLTLEGKILKNFNVLCTEKNQRIDKFVFQNLSLFFSFSIFKFVSLFKLMPYLKIEENSKFCSLIIEKDYYYSFFLFKNNLLAYKTINYLRTNLLEKYSKILTSSIYFFKRFSNFN